MTADPTGPELEVLVDNVRSLRNVGGMFRTADGLGVRHMHLGGVTPTPKHTGLRKTALGAERSVPWTHHKNGVVAAHALRDAGMRLWALEAGPRSVPVFDVLGDLSGPPIVVTVGHEVSGIDPRILEVCENVVRLPMLGIKGSFNVSVALGIALFLVRHGERLRESGGETP